MNELQQVYKATDVGLVRKGNEDNLLVFDKVYAVADGMGGHKAGDYASRTSISSFVKFARNAKETTPIRIIDQGIMAVNQAIYSKSLEDSRYEGMGTTIVVAYIVGNQLFAANVGDSRLYLIGEEASQVTEDHSYVAEMVRAGEMTKEQALSFAKRAIALGYYTQNGVSIGYCAQIAGMTEVDFIKYLSENHVSIFRFDDAAEFAEEMNNA